MIEIKTASDITGNIAKQLRLERKMSQAEFWGAVGKSQSNGVHHEKGRDGRSEIPKSVKTLIFAIYVLGLKIDVSTEEGVERAKFLAKAQERADAEYQVSRADREAKEARQKLARTR